MKGFYIEITNNLLEIKHRKRMGVAVWEYMWCLDRMTKIDDDGVGWVLGGKPIKLEEIEKELGIHRVNISKHLTTLEKYGYLKLIHAPYGISIRVYKAKKRFNRIAKPRNEIAKPKRFSKIAKPNKTVSVKTYTEDNINSLSRERKRWLSKSTPLTKKTYTLVDEEIVKLLHNTVLARYPFLEKKMNYTKDCEELNKLHRLDGWTYEQIQYVAKWSQEDAFWKQNIRSVSNLRKHFNSMVIRIKESGNKLGVIKV